MAQCLCDWYRRGGVCGLCETHQRLAVLATNLRWAGALCRAFMLGHNTGWTGLGAQCPGDWFPGCGRSAP